MNSANVSNPWLEPRNGIKRCCLPPPFPFKNRLKANINIYETSDLNKYRLDLAKKSCLFCIKFKQLHIFNAYSKFHCVIILYVRF